MFKSALSTCGVWRSGEYLLLSVLLGISLEILSLDVCFRAFILAWLSRLMYGAIHLMLFFWQDHPNLAISLFSFSYFLPLPSPPLRLAAQSAGQVERRGQKRSASNLPTGSTVIGYFLQWLQDPVWESFIEFLLESISFPILFQTCSSSPPSRDALSFETVAAGQDLSPWTAGSVIRCEEGILCRPESTHSTGDDCTDSSMLLGMRSWMSRGRYLGAEWNGLN